MGMKTQSSDATRYRAKELSASIGSYHIEQDIDDQFNAQNAGFAATTGFEARFKLHGGSVAENLALQNNQARIRMLTAYNYSSLMTTVRGRPGAGSLLVLGSGNVRIFTSCNSLFRAGSSVVRHALRADRSENMSDKPKFAQEWIC